MKFCNLDTSTALKDLGYDGEYTKIWHHWSEGYWRLMDLPPGYNAEITPAPRLDDAAYFIRDKYGLAIELQYTSMRTWLSYVTNTDNLMSKRVTADKDYEACLEAALIKAIDYITEDD